MYYLCHIRITMKRYEKMTWEDISNELKNQMLVIPIGSIEQHGPHLPVYVDSYLATKLAEEIAREIGGIIAPTISYGGRSLPGSGGGNYPGTIYINGNTLIEYYYDIVCGFINSGAKRILIINGHWENEAFIFEAVEKCREDKHLENRQIIVLSWWSVINEKEMKEIFGTFPGWHAEHAGQAETALMMYYSSTSVKKERMVDCSAIPPAGIYWYPVPERWSGAKGCLSESKTASAIAGSKLANLIIKKITLLINGNNDTSGSVKKI